MSPLHALSPAGTLTDGQPKEISIARKLLLLVMLCLTQFLTTFNGSALYSALPTLDIAMGMTESQSTWMLSAFQLTFASFLLISGRVSDVYNPRNVFIGGVAGLGVVSLCAGFVDNKIPMIICRALMGIAGAMTIPSALTLIVGVFHDPRQQTRGIGLFIGASGVASVFGFLIGAMFVKWASYHWVFWFVATIALPVALSCILVIPPQITKTKDSLEPEAAKWRSLDLVGVTVLTVALILFIFAVTSGSTDGWASAIVLVPLVASILMMVAFFCWEARIPVEEAAIPPRTWSYKNFSVLFAVALLPVFFWGSLFLTFTNLWQNIFHWSVISSAIHMLPIGIAGFAASFTGPLARVCSPKWIILTGLSLCLVAIVLLALGGGKPEDYWPYVFPAFVLGSAGNMLTYSHANIAILQAVPPSMAGTVGAIFNCALQCGSAVGLAAITSIQTAVEATHGGSQEYTGRAAAFWFIFAIVALEFISVSIFYNHSTVHKPQPTYSEPMHPAQASFDEKLDDVDITMPGVDKNID